MAISRVKTGGYSVGDKLTSADANGIDLNVTNALDKRAAHTDTLASTVSVTGAVNASSSGAKLAATASGAKIRTETGGRIELADNDYPTLASGHTGRTVTRHIRTALASRQCTTKASDTNLFSSSGPDWVAFDGTNVKLMNGGRVQFGNADTSQALTSYAFVLCLDSYLIDGATLTQVVVNADGTNGHTGLPTRMPRFSVNRLVGDLGEAPESSLRVLLHSSGSTIVDTAANTTVYDDYHAITGTMNQNNVIDKSTYSYWIGVWAEGGTNATSGPAVANIVLTQTITDLRPG